MKKNQIAALLLCAALLCSLLLAACGKGSSADDQLTGDLLSRLQQKGEIIVAMEGTWAPWTYHDEADQLVGYDVEVAKAIADKLGVSVTYVEGEWDGLLAGRIDATLNAEVVFADYQKAHPEANIKVAAYSDEVERVAIPVRKGEDSASLLAAINAALAQMDADGTLTQLSEKYFSTDISKPQ